MENRGTRDDLTGRTDFGKSGTSFTSGSSFGSESSFAAGSTASDPAAFANAFPERAGMTGASGETSTQGEGDGGAMAKVDAGIEKAAGGIDKLVGAIRDRGDQMSEGSGATGAVGSVASTAADKLEGASAYLHQTDADRIMADLESLIRRRPTESLLAAAGIGFLLAKALR